MVTIAMPASDATAYPSKFGRVGAIARRAALRIMRPYTSDEARVDSAVVDALDELARVVDEHAARIDAVEHSRTS